MISFFYFRNKKCIRRQKNIKCKKKFYIYNKKDLSDIFV